ncbi:rho GTPase-activating protein 21-like [Conger conger]|uniref:rho GTPase-activating protein 21-like n=1 Tax=Conger conger TaxID=82655 RepID=UPI002A5AE955|nr:rho GTPase-activating protein 21-like [Conger conger]
MLLGTCSKHSRMLPSSNARNVLRLTTSGGELLFQAADREDMLSWIRLIQGNSNLGNQQSAGVTSQDLINRKIKEYTMLNSPSSKADPSPKPPRQALSLRHALLGGRSPSPPSPRHASERKPPHKEESSPPRDRGGWKRIPGLRRRVVEKRPGPGVTFGVRLDHCPPAHSNKFIPLIVEMCCALVEERGLEYTGIYRVPGNTAAIAHLQDELDRGMDINLQEDKWRDLNVISSLLKSFFRKLPEPLFTNEKYADFIEANRTEDSVGRLKALKTLLQQLPRHHYETLKFLSAHLKTVSENCEKNKMEPRNLAIVFGPTLVRTSEDNMTHMVTHMPDQYRIVETLIQQYDWFFSEGGAVEPTTSMPQEIAVESQPVPNIDHLLTNIGRAGLTSPGEVSDSPNSDSAKSKGSWGSGKEQYSRELLRSSIFAAASRKRKKHKEKPLPSSSDDDLDAVFPRKESQNRGPTAIQNRGSTPSQNRVPTPSQNRVPTPSQSQNLGPSPSQSQRPGWVEPDSAKRGESGGSEVGGGGDGGHGGQADRKQEAEPSLPEMEERGGETGVEKAPCPKPLPSPSPSLSYRGNRQSSLSDPTSQCDDVTSDLGTMNSSSSQASAPPTLPAPAPADPAPDPRGSEALAEVSSITSDYSTTSSLTFPFLPGPEASALSPEVRSVTESRGDEADDERSELVSEGRPAETDSESDFPVFAKTQPPAAAPPHPKTHSESSAEGGRGEREPGALSRVLAGSRGRSTGSLSSSSRSEGSERAEPPAPWRLRLTERFRLRLRSSADDMFGVSGGGAPACRTRSPDSRKKKGIRRRHTMGGQRDFASLAAAGDTPGGKGAGLCAVDRLKPRCSSQDFSVRDWIVRERRRPGNPDPAPATPACPEGGPEQLNGDSPPGKSQGALSLSGDAHPHKLSGAQVVRSRFYQYL